MCHMLVQIPNFLAEQQFDSPSRPENTQCTAPRPTSRMSGAWCLARIFFRHLAARSS